MQVIENAARLKARLLEIQPDADHPGWARIRLRVDEVAAVADLPKLFSVPVGQTAEARVGPEDAAALATIAVGGQVDVQVRVKAPGVYTVVPGSLTR